MHGSGDLSRLITSCREQADQNDDSDEESVTTGGEFKPRLEDLTPLEFVCRGPGGSISRSTHKNTGKKLIVKTMKINRRLQARIDREVEISLAMKHPQLIETYNVIYRDENRFLYMIQNFYEGGDLLDYVMKHGPMRTCPDLARWVVACVARALVHMGHEGVFHGDVKPENLLFESVPYHAPSGCHGNGLHGNSANSSSVGSTDTCLFPNVRLIDFGHSQYILKDAKDGEHAAPGMFGTLEYSAPEVFLFAESKPVDGQAADVWSLGVTLYALLFGSLPWAEPSMANKDFAAFVRRYNSMHPGVELLPCSARVAMGTGETERGSQHHTPGNGSSERLPRHHGAIFDDDAMARLGITDQLGELFDGMLCPDPEQRWKIEDVLDSELLRSKPWFAPNENAPISAGIADECVAGANDIGRIVSVAG